MQSATALPAPAWLTITVWSPALAPGESGAVRVVVPGCGPGDPAMAQVPATLPPALVVEGVHEGRVGAFVAGDGSISITFRNGGDRPLASGPAMWRVAVLPDGVDAAAWDGEE